MDSPNGDGGLLFVKRLGNHTPDVTELIRRLNVLEPHFNEARAALKKEISYKLQPR